MHSVHQVEDPVSASKQNDCTADDCRNEQDRHLNLLMFIHVYTTRDHNIKTGRSMSAINMVASFSEVYGKRSGPRLVPDSPGC
jgi:hypothetical protein